MNKGKQVPFIPLSKETGDTRVLDLHCSFTRKFGKPPSFIIRVPGRVNLIGEHIDYHGFPVLPMAIERDILVAVGSNDKGVLSLCNVQQEMYADYKCDTSQLDVASPPSWYHYFFCGFRGAMEKHKTQNGYCNGNGQSNSFGINACFDGTVPPSAGLSSSSALVCASTLAVLSLLNNSPTPIINKSEIAALSAESERYIGTQGGGMDQAIAFLAEEGCAKIIEFEPVLEARNVDLPDGASFYISHSGKTLNKAATHHFNTRVFETRLAAALIVSKTSGLENCGTPLKFFTLKDAIKISKMGLDEIKQRLHRFLRPEKLYNIDDLLQELDLCNTEDLIRLVSGQSETAAKRFNEVIANSSQNGFPLYDRALHVFEEAARVYEFRDICLSNLSCEAKLQGIGHLMNLSHQSCKNLYDCSCDELDEMVDASKASGALGARLTGAGWGGCVVSLVPDVNKKTFEDSFSIGAKFAFCSRPSAGAFVYVCDI